MLIVFGSVTAEMYDCACVLECLLWDGRWDGEEMGWWGDGMVRRWDGAEMGW